LYGQVFIASHKFLLVDKSHNQRVKRTRNSRAAYPWRYRNINYFGRPFLSTYNSHSISDHPPACPGLQFLIPKWLHVP